MTIVQFPTKITALRQQLRRNGFHPLPTYARQQLSEALPIRYPFMPDWFETDDEDIRHWEHDHRATATAVAAKFAPALFIRCNIEAAAEAAEEVVREHFEKRGDTCVCLRWPTQRLILMRTNEPFAKSSRTFFSPNDDEHQVEIFGDGQMYIVDGQVENLLTIQHKTCPASNTPTQSSSSTQSESFGSRNSASSGTTQPLGCSGFSITSERQRPGSRRTEPPTQIPPPTSCRKYAGRSSGTKRSTQGSTSPSTTSSTCSIVIVPT